MHVVVFMDMLRMVRVLHSYGYSAAHYGAVSCVTVCICILHAQLHEMLYAV